MKSKYNALRNLSISLFLSLPFTANAEVEMLDRIVAIVDKRIISQSELDGRIGEIVQRSKNTGVNLPSISKLREQVLDQLILETLQLNVAARFDIKTTDQQVLGSIRGIMSQRKLNEAQLNEALIQDGLTLNEFKESVRRQLTLQTISQGVVSSRIKIAETDIDNFLKSADAQFWISPEYHLQHIIIPVKQGGTSAITAAQEKVEAIYQKITNGTNFTELAIAESKGPAALKGGDLGWRKSSELPTLFAEIAPTLEKDEVTKPFRSQAGFHIIKMLEKRGETKQIVTQSNVRHILIKPNEILDSSKTREKLEQIRQQILNGDSFKTLAKKHSDDIGSKATGGELGWSTPGSFVAEFEQTMSTIEVGEISEPFLSQFGWHILQVTERREEDLGEEVIRNRARNLLIGRRFADEVQVWLQEMRDEAFIEIKI